MTDLSMVDLIYVLETLQQCGTRVKRTARTRGGNYNGLCPLCGDRNGLYILPEAVNEQGQREGKWACRTCHPKESDAIGMLVHYDKLTYAQAFARLRELYPDLPNSSNYKSGTKAKPAQIRIKPLAENAVPPSQEWQARARKVLTASQEWLWRDQGKEARDYLLRRKLTEATIKSARYGFLWLENGQKDIREPAHYWGLSLDDCPDGVYLPSGIVIPYFYKGDLWKLRIRRLGDNILPKDRYSMISGGSNGLYNADDIQPGQPVLEFEGEIDADSAKQSLPDTIACVATGSITQARIPLWLSKLALASRVLICFDNDKKSETTAEAITYWKDRLANSKVYALPSEYKDANDMLCAGGDICSWALAGLGIEAPPLPAQPEPQAQPEQPPLQGGQQEAGRSWSDLVQLVRRNNTQLTPDEVISVACILAGQGVTFSETGPFVATWGPYPLAICPELKSEQVIRFTMSHESVILDWLQQGAPGVIKPQPQASSYTAAKKFYQDFCAQSGYYLRIREDGEIGIGVPETVSDEVFTRMSEQVMALGDGLFQVIADQAQSEKRRSHTCCKCSLPAAHYSPSGDAYCTMHYMCAAGHVPDWKQSSQGTWLCRCVVDRMPLRVEQTPLN